MKRFTFLMLAAAIAAGANAEYTTEGNKEVFTFKKLSESILTGVTYNDGVYTVPNSITIANGDTLRMEDGDIVKLGGGVRITIEGYADLTPATKGYFDKASDTTAPKGVHFTSTSAGEIKNIDFNASGVRYLGCKDISISKCNFKNVTTALNSEGVISIASPNVGVSITDCTFEDCQATGIGCGANIACRLVVRNNHFKNCNTMNTNKPYINVTVGGQNPVYIEDNVIEGAKLSKVGGIAVGNLLSMECTEKVYIRRNDIRHCRYGITTVGPMSVVIADNILLDNCHDPKPMSGGSGISLSDSSKSQSAMVSGNHIEGNYWGITVIGCGNVNIGRIDVPEKSPFYNPGGNVFKNNENSGKKFDLYNNSPNKVYAQNNTWGVDTQDEESIETVIFHKKDNITLGEVIFMPAKSPSSVGEIATDTAIRYDAASQCVYFATPTSANVYSISGAIVTAASNATELDLSGLGNGVYIVKTATATAKIVK